MEILNELCYKLWPGKQAFIRNDLHQYHFGDLFNSGLGYNYKLQNEDSGINNDNYKFADNRYEYL